MSPCEELTSWLTLLVFPKDSSFLLSDTYLEEALGEVIGGKHHNLLP